ncbi:MAG: hypothetical protein SPE31_03840, partial [Prevotella sp.]|nr:hypothetical protein [Prevotella sp.]
YSRILCNFAVRDKCTFWLKTIYPNDDKTKNVFVKQERGGRPSLFGTMPCKEEESEAKIRHIQYPKPNYKH